MRDRIVESPDDLGLRRVYADALLERCDPRGQFIHVQLALSEQPTKELQAAEQALLHRYLQHWVAPIRAGHGSVKFVNGFVEEWGTNFDELLRRGHRVLRSVPLRKLTLLDADVPVQQARVIRRVRELELRGLRRWPFIGLAEIPFVRLERLVLAGAPWDRCSALAGALRLWAGHLRELVIEFPLDRDAIADLTREPLNLESLTLVKKGLSAEAQSRLRASKTLRQLRLLN